ncbi:polysaccharide deacetylase family protein [Nocardioides sp. NPDC047086]|uniref:polysaccharide deacetylase family protein n=1 Tax=Nocardioides sp. NPDC047086 TaxID=3154810 RepID=UPI0033C98149
MSRIAAARGAGGGSHIALTFDDGPDPASTPAFLDLLAAYGRRATFFVLGSQAADHPELIRRITREGHELAIHGWTHRCTLALPPTRLTRGIRRARDVVEDISGEQVTWYRPPYGVPSGEAVLACRALGLTPVLWTAWGREWERAASPDTVVATVLRTLRPGGTILLHDTDLHAPHGDWRRTLAATEQLLAGPLASANVGTLGEHWREVPCENGST